MLNPIRARMVKDIQDWKRSSYLAMIGKNKAPKWLETGWLLGHFSKNQKEAQRLFIGFVREGIGLDPIWEGVIVL
jgi:hypothetical protein